MAVQVLQPNLIYSEKQDSIASIHVDEIRTVHPVPEKPLLSFVPSYEEYIQRGQRRLLCENLTTTLPKGFPSRVDSPIAWEGKQFEGGEWIVQLTDTEVIEIEEATAHFQSLGLKWGHIAPATFPLPTLKNKLLRIKNDVWSGMGFSILRGIDPKKYSSDENAIMFAGLASYVGDKRIFQHLSSGALAHIVDVGETLGPKPLIEIPFTSEAQPFHTDLTDVLAMYSIDTAYEGGSSILASSWTIYNELAANRPDIIHTLCEDWHFDNLVQGTKYRPRPLLYYEGSKIILNFTRRHFTGNGNYTRSPELPPLTEAQAEALDAIHFTAAKHQLKIAYGRGDMHFVNNLALLHSRESFRNGGPQNQQRHLMRLWVTDADGDAGIEKVGAGKWRIPEKMRKITGEAYHTLEPEEEVFPMEVTRKDAQNRKHSSS